MTLKPSSSKHFSRKTGGQRGLNSVKKLVKSYQPVIDQKQQIDEGEPSE